MQHTCPYTSPIGSIILASDGESLTGLWFEEQKYFPAGIENCTVSPELPIFNETKRWLDIYFSGKDPGKIPPVKLTGSEFRMKVWALLQQIPYGETVTYGDLAKRLGETMSAQAVGGAVGHNPISIIVPCHRVLGANRNLTGYAGGMWRKEHLLKLEGIL